MGFYNTDGTVNTTTVPGSSYVGIKAPDGGTNVVLDDAVNKGVYHPSGAIRVNSGSGNTFYDSTGAVYSNHLFGPGRGGTNPLAPYTGQVATRTYLPDANNLTNKQLRGRTVHTAMDSITNLTLIFPNFYVDGFGAGATYAELGVGAASTITAAIEYPSGVFTQVLFGGSSSGSIPNVGTIVGTANVSIAKGDIFFVRTFVTNPNGIVFCLGVSAPSVSVPGNFGYGDVLDAAASGLTDNTMGGAYTATSGSSRYSPMIIAATTTLPSVLVIGDSKSYGENDVGDGTGNVGETQRWISPFFAVANWGIRGRDAGQFVANSTIQTSFNNYFTHLISEDGVNCFIHGQNAATAAANTDALANKFPTLKKYVTTVLPVATTTDNYATLVNQTTASYNTDRVTENTRRRGVPAPWLGCFDSAAAIESSLNSGLITPALSYFNTSSSVHPAPQGYIRVEEANRSAVASTINRDGNALSFSNRAFVHQMDSAVDATSQTTYTFGSKNFLIGSANANRVVVAGFSSRFGTTGATLNSVTIGGVSATKVAEVIDVTGGAESITSVWAATVPTGTTATISATFSTAMLRCGVDVYTAVGYSRVPTLAGLGASSGTSSATTGSQSVPALGGAISFSSGINGTVPTCTLSNVVTMTPVTLIGGTMYYTSGYTTFAGSKTFNATYSTSVPTTIVAVVVTP